MLQVGQLSCPETAWTLSVFSRLEAVSEKVQSQFLGPNEVSNPFGAAVAKDQIFHTNGWRCYIQFTVWMNGRFLRCPAAEKVMQRSNTCSPTLTSLQCLIHTMGSPGTFAALFAKGCSGKRGRSLLLA